MESTTDELKEEMKRSRALLRTLRDELRVRIHLLGRELDDLWRRRGALWRRRGEARGRGSTWAALRDLVAGRPSAPPG
jgi:hypothetical protein